MGAGGRGRIELLKRAHRGRRGAASVSEEDYLEAIYEVERVYGYARITDISEVLGVKPPTALGMVRRLEEKGLVVYEKYRGVRLTEEGRRLAERIARNHEFLREFLIAIGVDEERANVEAELIEHFLSQETLERLRELYRDCLGRRAGQGGLE